jgi:crotonobetainyl-CoA:carnitine CoA-transferase CaiB-like acyl-CoA transferase
MSTPETAAPRSGPLAGFRVVDLTWMVAGPFATLILALLGAEVIKIESAGRLDALRRLNGGMDIPPGDVDSSPYFAQLNANKLGVTLNLKSPEGIALAKRLVAESHVVVEGFRGGVMDRMGLGYSELRKVREQLVMLSLSTNGAGSRDAALPGYAPIFAAASGLGTRTGYADGPPTELRVSVDVRVGYAAAFALLGAIWSWRRTGQGRHIDFAATEVVTSVAGEGLLEYQLTGRIPGRQGNDRLGSAPHDCYRCAGTDAWVAIAVDTDAEWAAFCAATGLDALRAHTRFAGRVARWENRELLRPYIEGWTRGRSAAAASKALQAAGVPSAPSATYADLLADPHLAERGLLGRVPHRLLAEGALVVGLPWITSPGAAPPLVPAPRLGEHNGYVFGELLGMSEAEIRANEESGAIR